MQLSELLREVEVLRIVGPPDRDIREVHFDSRKIQSGDLFVAVPGTQADGHAFIPRVVEAGARVVVCERLPEDLGEATYVVVRSASLALGHVANAYYGHPSRSLTLVGVTGTNGKTTTATLLYRLFQHLGHRTGLLSTIRNYAGDEVVPSTHTTGDAIQIASLMAKMVSAGCTHCFMEVTSHAIHQHRIAGLRFQGAVFTNLSHDHLDYHGTMEAYRDVKKSYFDGLSESAFSLTNSDDGVGAFMVSSTRSQRFTYGTSSSSNFPLIINHSDASGLDLAIDGYAIRSRLVGNFNAYNLAAVFGTAVLLGCEPAATAVVLRALDPVEGRMERIAGPGGTTAVVDFAHTPDALEKVLAALRGSATNSELYCVVGCGGDRDQDKRAVMAEIAARGSDHVIFTTDNPRSEDPLSIIAAMESGVPPGLKSRVTVIPDRRAAISAACHEAPPGAIILIAGKGHEKYQEIRGERHPFDDVECAREAFLIR